MVESLAMAGVKEAVQQEEAEEEADEEEPLFYRVVHADENGNPRTFVQWPVCTVIQPSIRGLAPSCSQT